eukprot:UN10951
MIQKKLVNQSIVKHSKRLFPNLVDTLHKQSNLYCCFLESVNFGTCSEFCKLYKTLIHVVK